MQDSKLFLLLVVILRICNTGDFQQRFILYLLNYR